MQRLPLALSLVLGALAFLSPAREVPSLVRTFVGAALVLGAWNLLLLRSARRRGRTLTSEIVLRKQHYLQACAQGVGAAVLGLVLARGVRLGASHPGATALRLRLRHAPGLVAARHLHARLRAVSRHLQHQPVSLVQARLVLPPVPHGRARLRRQGADSLGEGRPARAHLQSLVVSARGFRARADSHGHERPHLGPGDREHAVLSASHVPDALPDRSARTVLLRRDNDDLSPPW